MTEFDYRREASSLTIIGKNMKQSPYNHLIRIPQACTRLCTKELLVMELLPGKKLSDELEDQLTKILADDNRHINAKEVIKKKRLRTYLFYKKKQKIDTWY